MQTALQCETFVSEFLLAGHHLPPVNLPLRIAYSSSRESAEEKNGREEAGEKFKQARRGPKKEKAIGKKMERRTGAILTVFQAYTFAIWSGEPTFFECVLHNYIITLNSNLVPRAFPLKVGGAGKALGTRLIKQWTFHVEKAPTKCKESLEFVSFSSFLLSFILLLTRGFPERIKK